MLILFFTLFSQQSFAQQNCRDLFPPYQTVQGKEVFVFLRNKFAYYDLTYELKYEAIRDVDGEITITSSLTNDELAIQSVRQEEDLFQQMREHFGLELIPAEAD